MEVIVFALKLVAAGLILTPFVGAIGCAWINHYFKMKQKIADDMVDLLKKKIAGS